MIAVVAAFNQEKALVGAFSVITNLRMVLFEALPLTGHRGQECGKGSSGTPGSQLPPVTAESLIGRVDTETHGHIVTWSPPAPAFVFGPHLVIRLKNTQDCQLKNSPHSQPRSCSPDDCGMLLRFPSTTPDLLLLFNLIK